MLLGPMVVLNACCQRETLLIVAPSNAACSMRCWLVLLKGTSSPEALVLGGEQLDLQLLRELLVLGDIWCDALQQWPDQQQRVSRARFMELLSTGGTATRVLTENPLLMAFRSSAISLLSCATSDACNMHREQKLKIVFASSRAPGIQSVTPFVTNLGHWFATLKHHH
jgi:hypothetical protein